MNKRTVVLVCSLLAALVVGMFTYTFMAREQMAPTEPIDPVVSVPVVEKPYGIERIDAKHFYQNGTHTVVGELPMPTPCDLLEAEALVAESMPEQITLALTVTNTTEACAMVVTPQRFMVSVGASELATWSATINGVPVELNLMEAEPGEDPTTVIIESKG